MTESSRLESVPERAARLYRLLLVVASLPVILAEFFDRETGAQYGVDTTTKLALVVRMARNNLRLPTGSTFVEHLVVATKVLSVPKDVEGVVVECGCYKGGSTANLSLVAALCDRELVVFDSFEGLPEPDDDDRAHTLPASGVVHTYSEGTWRAPIEEVRRNVVTYGEPEVIRLEKGYFEESLPRFDERCVAAFIDVGIRTSAETCLEHLWPQLEDGCYAFTHEAKHLEIASLYYDPDWWERTLDQEPPGLVGAGNGLGLHPDVNGFSSMLGYAVKNPPTETFEEVEAGGQGHAD